MFEAMPKVLLQAFGLTDVRVLATPEGFVGLAYFTYAAIVMAIYAVSAGMSITANDEENGIDEYGAGPPGVAVVDCDRESVGADAARHVGLRHRLCRFRDGYALPTRWCPASI
ncbi:MAG: hypothetical protein HND48_01075 [Chloroflexi bacterium]|nr:hypothetical protein [Chloroflexota bacterium]